MKAWQKQNGVLALANVPEPKPAADQLAALEVVSRIEDAKGPFDRILESVGDPSLTKAIELVGSEGVVAVFGISSEQDSTLNARTLFNTGAATMRELEKREYPGKAVMEVGGRA